MKRYSYCLLRYYPDLRTEEFANVAVLVCAPEHNYVGFRHTRKWKRLGAFFGSVNGLELVAALRNCSQEFDRYSREWREGVLFPQEARELGEAVVPLDDSALQWGRLSGGFSEDLPRTLDLLYERHIGRFEVEQGSQRRKDEEIWNQTLGSVFAREDVLRRLRDIEIVAPHDSYHFNHAWKNGQWHLFEPVSLDLSDRDNIQNKALRWFGRAAQLQESPEEFKLHLILGEPKDEGLRPAYVRARDVLHSAQGVKVVEERDAESFGRYYAEEIKSHE